VHEKEYTVDAADLDGVAGGAFGRFHELMKHQRDLDDAAAQCVALRFVRFDANEIVDGPCDVYILPFGTWERKGAHATVVKSPDGPEVSLQPKARPSDGQIYLYHRYLARYL